MMTPKVKSVVLNPNNLLETATLWLTLNYNTLEDRNIGKHQIAN